MIVKFKKLSEKSKIPTRAHNSDAGYDLTASNITTEVGEDAKLIIVYHTDIAVEIPEGYMGLVFPRSSIFKKSLTLTNSVGVVDSGYRGEIMCKFKTNTDVIPSVYKEGERFAQLIIVPYTVVEFEETNELSDGDRNGGHGTTGDEAFTEESAMTEELARQAA